MITLPGEVDGHRVRVGCDVVAIEDVQDSLAAFGDRYLRKVFTASEINDCQGRNRVQRLAARFAAKEAVIKAFAEPDMPFPLREIEVTRDGPLPLLRLSGTLAERAQHQGWLSSSLSLSHADCHAMAVVLVVCGPADVNDAWAGRGMTRRHDPAWVWMIGAFGGALALAVAVLAGYGTGPDGLRQGVRFTARWSFLFFWLSYAGGAMAILFGPAFAGLARRARALGLAFAAALQVHIGLVVWLGVVIGQIPLQGGLLWFFLVALFFSLSAGAAVLRNRNAQPGTSVAATALPGHDLHSDRLRPGFCAGRTRPEDTALALRRRISAVRPVEPHCNPAAPCRVSSPALRLAVRHGLTHLVKLFLRNEDFGAWPPDRAGGLHSSSAARGHCNTGL